NGAQRTIVRASEHAAGPVRLEDHILHVPAFAYFYALPPRIIQQDLIELRALDVIGIRPREVFRVLRGEQSYLLPAPRHATDDPLLRHESGRLDLRRHVQAIPQLPQRRQQRLTGMEPWEALPFQDEHLEPALCKDRGSTRPPGATADNHDVEPLGTYCGFRGKSGRAHVRPRPAPAGAERS